MEFALYENLLNETKIFLNKAMDVYASVKDKKIEYFSELDKRILSLLAASLLVEGRLKDFISDYKDIELSKVLDFMEITEDDIKPLIVGYKEFYLENFKDDLVSMDFRNEGKQKYKKTPLVIFSYFNNALVNGSGILNAFANYCDFNSAVFCEHPIFNKLEKLLSASRMIDELNDKPDWDKVGDRWQELYATIDGKPEKNDSNKSSSFAMPRRLIGDIVSSSSFGIETETKEDENKSYVDEKEQVRKKELEYWESEDLWDILEDIKKKFIGQEEAVEDIFYNIVNNQRMILNGNLEDGERSIMFIDGPTGTGKTAIIREISKRLNIPFHRSSSTSYSPTGYVGGDVESILSQLFKESDNDLEKAQRGIVAFDEFDKLVYNPQEGNKLELKKAVQQQLLDFMGGGTYKIPIVRSVFGSISGNFDTSKLTFICLGALTNLREKKSTVTKSMGFNSDVSNKKKETYEITPQDLIDFGYERELVGRLNTYLHTEEYSKEILLKILKESEISPMKGFINWVKGYNKELIIEEGVYEAIAEEAYSLDTGARSLQTVMNSIRTSFLKQVMRSKDHEVYLDIEAVNQACKRATMRKSR